VPARRVAELGRRALAPELPVTLRTADGTSVDLRSVLAVMDLALASGDAVTLETPAGPASESVLDQLALVLAPDA
jgi:phosphocarrier protein